MRASALVKSDSKKVLAVSLVLAVMMLDLAAPAFAEQRGGGPGGGGFKRGNPPGPQGGPGAGPRYGNNPPGQAGGPGTSLGNPPGPQGGPGTGPQWQQFKQQMIQRRVDKLTAFREKMVAQGAPADKLAKIDRRIQMLQAKTQPEQQAAQETVAAETAPAETQASQ